MNLQLNIEENQKIILSASTGKTMLQDEPVLFSGKAKTLAKFIKKLKNGKYWLSIVNIEETREMLMFIKITNKKINLIWPE